MIIGTLIFLFSTPSLADSSNLKRQKQPINIDTALITVDSLTMDTVSSENLHVNPTYVKQKAIPLPQPLYSLFFRKTIIEGMQIDSCVGKEQYQKLYNWVECDTSYYLTQYIGYDLQPKRQRQPSDALLFSLLMLVVVVFTIIKQISENFWIHITETVININLAKQFFEEQLNYQSALPNTLIYFAISLLNAIWLFLLLRYFKQTPNLPDWQFFLALWGISGTYFALRQLTLQIAAFVLRPINDIIRFYIFNLTISNTLIAALLIPIAFLFAFGHQAAVTYWLIYVLIGILGLGYLYNIYRTIQISQDIVLNYKFHYLLYLCSIEIAPILVIAKIIKNNIL